MIFYRFPFWQQSWSASRACTLLTSQAEQAAKSVHVPAGMRDFSTDGWGYQILDFSNILQQAFLPPIFSLSLKLFFASISFFLQTTLVWKLRFNESVHIHRTNLFFFGVMLSQQICSWSAVLLMYVITLDTNNTDSKLHWILKFHS